MAVHLLHPTNIGIRLHRFRLRHALIGVVHEKVIAGSSRCLAQKRGVSSRPWSSCSSMAGPWANQAGQKAKGTPSRKGTDRRKARDRAAENGREWQTMADNGRQWQTMADNGRPAGDDELVLALLPRSTPSASVRMVNEMAS
jgi:hypothetical protein